jgi:uncharacterized protein YbaP (TraB family)
MRRLAGALAAALAMILAAPAAAEPPVWIVRDADSTMILFGSVHVLPDDLEWRTPALMAGVAAADDIWFEIPLSPEADAEISRRMLIAGLLPPGQSLFARLPGEDAARLRRIALAMGLYEPGLDRLRPWMAELTLSLAVDARTGAEAENGVERRLNTEAPAATPRRALETVEQQVVMLSGSSEAGQIASLSETMREVEADPTLFRRIIDEWSAGDTAGLTAHAVTPLQTRAPEVYQRLIVRRNRDWTPQLRQRLDGSGTTVVVVGVGHLVGPDSVPAMLRAQGVMVEGP